MPIAAPIVSVLIPTFNRAAFLKQAIRSVLSQRLADFELIVVDDGSTDRTAEMMSAFNDDRIIFVRQAQQGRSRARNRGLELARGAYVCFLDDDDAFTPMALAAQVEYLNQHGETELVAGGAILIDEANRCLGYWATWQMLPQIDLAQFLKGSPLFPSIVMLRRSALEKVDHWFDAALEPAEDVDFFNRLMLAGCQIDCAKHWAAYYRQHPGSSQGDARRYRDSKIRVLDKVFSRSDLPFDVRARQSEIYARAHLGIALHAFAVGETELGREEFGAAIQLNPKLNEGYLPDTLKAAAATANSFLVREPDKFWQTFWLQLPPEVNYSYSQRLKVRALSCIQRVFSAYSLQGPAGVSLRDWLYSVSFDPSWLLNRGVWSIGFKSVRQKLGGAAGRSGENQNLPRVGDQIALD